MCHCVVVDVGCKIQPVVVSEYWAVRSLGSTYYLWKIQGIGWLVAIATLVLLNSRKPIEEGRSTFVKNYRNYEILRFSLANLDLISP